MAVTRLAIRFARPMVTLRDKDRGGMSTSSKITETQDWDAASRAVAGAYFPHELTALTSEDAPRLVMRTVDLGSVTIGRLGFGADVAIACDYPGAYEVNIPLSGRLESESGREQFVSLPGQATVFSANTPSVITKWSASCQVIGVKFDGERLERDADRILGSPVRSRLRLPGQVDLTAGEGRTWLQLVRSISGQLREPADLLANPLVGEQLAGAITSAFILAVTPNDEIGGAPRPRIVKRVLDALHDAPERAWTAADMAQIAGTSVRRLQEGFQQWVGKTPSACLLDIRLSRAQEELASGAGAFTVSDVAARWGFSNASRFAAAYKRRYGVSPSSELR